MSLYTFEILTLLSELENESFLAEALLFPEVSRLEARPDKVVKNLRNSVPVVLDELPTVVFHTRRAPQDVEVREVSVEIKPPKRDIYWKDPLPLTFQAACWQQGATHHAFVPALTIEVVADSEAELDELLPVNILSELQRRDAAGRLGKLIRHQRSSRLHTERAEVTLHAESPQQKARKLDEAGGIEPVLKEVATDLIAQGASRAFEVEEQVARLADLLVGAHGRSVLMVGNAGVGKTAIAHELVRRRRHHHLAATPFWETTGARLMVGADAFGDWQERCHNVVAEASGTRAILLLGNLFELAEVARHSSSPQGMAGFFRPYIERGELLCIVECTPEQRDLLERDHPHLLKAFAVMQIDTPSADRVGRILAALAPADSVSEAALQSIDSLHRRFARYSAYPGRPIRFLEELLLQNSAALQPSDVARGFSRETGLPQFMIDDSLPLDLGKAREFFLSRVLGQDEAVDLTVDLLASVKANLSPPGRPIASLLFIGPTGVGKTEMARTLAHYLFQSRHRMVRFDMSEYADPYAVERLVSGQGGGQGLLTGKVREQPFGVVLFDELEKAHPSFFDLLLQILGEGRLTDEGGRLADFTNSLIVMTSNLGAGSFSKGLLGFRSGGDPENRAKREFTSAVKAAFRPELFNRIDRLVPFAPLSRQTAGLVAAREVERLRERDGLGGEQLQLEMTAEVIMHLAEVGYDPRYGARPLKRAIERTVLEPLAKIASESAGKDTVVELSWQDETIRWKVSVNSDQRQHAHNSLAVLADDAMRLRRDSQKVLDSQFAHALRNDIQRLSRMRARFERNPHLPPEILEELKTLNRKLKLRDALKEMLRESLSIESHAVLSLGGFEPTTEALQTLGQKISHQRDQLKETAVDLLASHWLQPDRATVILYPHKGQSLKLLAEGYNRLWEDRGFTIKCYRLSLGLRKLPDEPEDDIVRLHYGEELENRALCCEPTSFEKSLGKEPFGVAVEITGKRALPLMMGEAGLHLFGSADAKPVEVIVLDSPLADYEPPEGLHLTRITTGIPKRRTYNHVQGHIDDPRTEQRKTWNGKSLERLLPEFVVATMYRYALEACS